MYAVRSGLFNKQYQVSVSNETKIKPQRKYYKIRYGTKKYIIIYYTM